MLYLRMFCAAVTFGLLLGNSALALNDGAVLTALGLRESALPAREMKPWRRPQKMVVLIDSTTRLSWFREAAVTCWHSSDQWLLRRWPCPGWLLNSVAV
jgi:hypothetical protein